jgi:F-type H+-transporting ATPase subunit alpha
MLVQKSFEKCSCKSEEFEKDFLEFLNNKHRATLDALKAGKLTDEITDVIQTVAKEISAKYNYSE